MKNISLTKSSNQHESVPGLRHYDQNDIRLWGFTQAAKHFQLCIKACERTRSGRNFRSSLTPLSVTRSSLRSRSRDLPLLLPLSSAPAPAPLLLRSRSRSRSLSAPLLLPLRSYSAPLRSRSAHMLSALRVTRVFRDVTRVHISRMMSTAVRLAVRCRFFFIKPSSERLFTEDNLHYYFPFSRIVSTATLRSQSPIIFKSNQIKFISLKNSIQYFPSVSMRILTFHTYFN